MTTSPASVTDLVAHYDELVQEGSAPDPETFCSKYPEYPGLLGRVRQLHRLRKDLSRLLVETRPGRNAAPRGMPEIPGFRFLRPLGHGGMGRVYLAEQLSPRRVCAVKVMDTSAPAAVERFRREADLAARLSHPGLATVYSFGVEGGQPYLAAEFVRGFPLRDLLRVADLVSPDHANEWFVDAMRRVSEGISADRVSTSHAPVQLIVSLALRVGEALAHAHGRGVIHRDVKPSNIVVGLDGSTKLIDFGIALAADEEGDDRLTRTGTFIGSHNYSAPEQLRGEHTDIGPWTDTYALGATLFEMLTQRTPFEAMSYADRLSTVNELPPRGPRSFNPKVSSALDTLVMRALAPAPANRFQDGEEMVEALRACPIEPSLLPAFPSRLLRRLMPRSWPAALAAAAVGLVCILAWVNLSQQESVARLRATYEAERALVGQGLLDYALRERRRELENCLAEGRLPLVDPGRFAAELHVHRGVVTRVLVGPETVNVGPGPSRCIIDILESLRLPGVGLVTPLDMAVDLRVPGNPRSP